MKLAKVGGTAAIGDRPTTNYDLDQRLLGRSGAKFAAVPAAVKMFAGRSK